MILNVLVFELQVSKWCIQEIYNLNRAYRLAILTEDSHSLS